MIPSSAGGFGFVVRVGGLFVASVEGADVELAPQLRSAWQFHSRAAALSAAAVTHHLTGRATEAIPLNQLVRLPVPTKRRVGAGET